MIRVLIFLLFTVCLNAQRTKTATDHKNDYDAEYTSAVEVDSRNAHLLSEAGGDMYWLGMVKIWPAQAVFMHTGDTTYLHDAINFAYARLDNATLSSTLINTYSNTPNGYVYWGDSHKTWIAHPKWTGSAATFPGGNYAFTSAQDGTGQEYNLSHGITMRYISGLVNLLKHCPTLLATNNGGLRGATYQDNYDDLLEFTIEQYDKWYNRSVTSAVGDNAFSRTVTHITSHHHKMALDLFYITGDSTYYDTYRNFMYDISLNPNSDYEGGFISTQLRTHADGGWIWKAGWGETTGQTDWGHSAAEFDLAYWSYKYGEPDFDATDMGKFATAVNNRLFVSGSTSKQYDFQNATIEVNIQQQTFVGWLLAAEFNEDILEKFEDLAFNGSDNDSAVDGVASYTAYLLDTGTPDYPEVDWTPGPLGVGGIPSITVTGADPYVLTTADTYTELGAVWVDAEDGTGAATVGGDVVNDNVIGTYVVTYNYTDANSNVAPQKTRTVNVEAAPFDETYVIKPRKIRIGTGGRGAYLGAVKVH